MKIAEQFMPGENTGDVVIKRTFDPNVSLKNAAQRRELLGEQRGDWRHVGTIPGWLIEMWVKEAGVPYNDIEARQEIIRKKLLSGEYNAFRTWGGTF